ncbi:hypothetical protein [Mesorhizobium sp. M4B.F.Ca.ET.169.01.1.1]|uniref:hypothetical protein n=1 Tax=Mesorhizobium sp. M4B.F.Ca.ET.169.01.1.1 TaxID=2563949 RepID=UPI0010933F68|nr:hypothetical protein [Mesorhizobium sp. M4B.F.Ca.ET.169.01.1.1]
MMAKLPEISLDTVEQSLLPRHRDIMFDLILTWAKIDGAIGAMIGSALNIPISDAAFLLEGWSTSARFQELIKTLKQLPGGDAAAATFRRHKKTYERFSRIRNRIAHAACAGYLREDAEYVVFLIFEKWADGQMTVESIPIDEMQAADRWGTEFFKLISPALTPNDPPP